MKPEIGPVEVSEVYFSFDLKDHDSKFGESKEIIFRNKIDHLNGPTFYTFVMFFQPALIPIKKQMNVNDLYFHTQITSSTFFICAPTFASHFASRSYTYVHCKKM